MKRNDKVTKTMFFKKLEKELCQYFSLEEVKEIIDDYHMFYDEKVKDGLEESHIINNFGEPSLIVNDLLKDRKVEVPFVKRVMNLQKTKAVASVLLVMITIMFLGLFQFSFIFNFVSVSLILFQILLFWYLYGYRQMVLETKLIEKRQYRFIELFSIISVVITYFVVVLLRLIINDRESIIMINRISISAIGPMVHYIIFISIIGMMSMLYKSILVSNSIWIHLYSFFIQFSSIAVLLNSHSSLANLTSSEAYYYYSNSLMITYSIVVLIHIIATIYISKKVKEGVV